MKKYLATALCGGLFVAVAMAGSVYDRVTASLGTTTGTGSWTNRSSYAALELKRIWVAGNLDATATVTVSRVTSDGVYTQSVGSVVCTGGAGSTATLTASYMKPGDWLNFANSTATGAVAIVEYEQQQH